MKFKDIKCEEIKCIRCPLNLDKFFKACLNIKLTEPIGKVLEDEHYKNNSKLNYQMNCETKPDGKTQF